MTDLPKRERNSSTYKVPTEIFKLPSKGLLYKSTNALSSGEIELKHMTVKEEDILTTESYIKNGTVLDKLYQSLIVTPGVIYDEILEGDKNAIMIAARILGYGPSYTCKILTPSGNMQSITIDLREIEHKDFNTDLITPGENSFKYTFPFSKAEITFKLLTHKDEQELAKESKKSFKDLTSKEVTSRYNKMITSVNGEKDELEILKFVSGLLAADSREFRHFIETIQPDMDLTIDAVDEVTGEPFRADLILDVRLFWPDARV